MDWTEVSKIDTSEPDCHNVEQLVKAKETKPIAEAKVRAYVAFMLARQFALWGIKCLDRKIKNHDNDEFPTDQEEILLKNIKYRIQDLKPDLVKNNNIRALKQLGLILEDYVPGEDAALNKMLMEGLQITYTPLSDKIKGELADGVAKRLGKDDLVEVYQPNPERPSLTEEYLKLRMDVHSLFKIKSTIREFLEFAKSTKGQVIQATEYDLALQRVFHVAGEFLKQTSMSPNLSEETRASLTEKQVPVDALGQYRNIIAHPQMSPMIKTTAADRKAQEETWGVVDMILENEIMVLEGNFFKQIISEKVKGDEQQNLNKVLVKCKFSVSCLMEKLELAVEEGTSQDAVKELRQYAAKMKSMDFPKQKAKGELKDEVLKIPSGTKKVIVDFIIASKVKLYGSICRELKAIINTGNVSLEDTVKKNIEDLLLTNHDNDMKIMIVRNILLLGVTENEEYLDKFFQGLPAKSNGKKKGELKRYFNSREIAEDLEWDLPDKTKMAKAQEILTKCGEEGGKVLDFLTKLHDESIKRDVNKLPRSEFTSKVYIEAVQKLNKKDVPKNYKEELLMVSLEWKKTKCAELLHSWFSDLMPLYDEIIGIGNKNSQASPLFTDILPVTAELFNVQIENGIKDMKPLKAPIAVESQVLNLVELLRRVKQLSELREGKTPSLESGDPQKITEKDIVQLRHVLGHGNPLGTGDEEQTMRVALVELKDKLILELEKAAKTGKKINFDVLSRIITETYSTEALKIKGIVCPNSVMPEIHKRNVESCLTWEDIEEVVDSREGPIDPDNIKIDSEKMMSVLKREMHTNVEKLENYIALTAESEIKGPHRSELVRVVHHKETYGGHLKKVEKFSGAAMHTMMAKNILGEVLRGDYKDVEVDLGFLGGSFLLGKISEIAARSGATFAREGSVMLGRSLKMASPLLAKGVSVFIAYDLWNQVKALESGDKDAIVSVVGDSIQLAVDATEVGIEIAEGLLLVEGVSSVTGPIGMAITATIFVGTEIYKAVREVDEIDKKIHLSGSEKFNEGVRAFFGMNPSLYINKLIEVKQGNNAAVENARTFLKHNTNLQRYVFPSYIQIGCYEPISALNSNVRLTLKVNDIEWSRSRPDDVPEVSIFCKPKGSGERVPEGWTYYCENAIGVEYNKDRTDNYTLINMGKGNAFVQGFQDSRNIFIINWHNKTLLGGSKDDSFMFHWDPTPVHLEIKKPCTDPPINVLDLLPPWSIIFPNIEALERVQERSIKIGIPNSKMVGFINGAGGIDTIDVEGLRNTTDSRTSSNTEEVIADFLQQSLKYTDQVAFNVTSIERFLGTTRKPDRVIAACNTTFIDGRGGDNEHAQDVIIIPNLNCSYNATIIINPHTTVTNNALTGNFQYFIRGNFGITSNIHLNVTSKTKNTFIIQYGLHDLAAIEKSKETLKFCFVKEFYSGIDTIEQDNSFNLTVSKRIEGNTYLLTDNTRIVVGKRNLYAMQNTDRAIDSIVDVYADLMVNLNMYLVVHSKNEMLTIAGPLNDVLTNDPILETSHFVSGAGENIYSFISGQDKLTMEKLPINDVAIHYFSKDDSVDRLDLREIMSQVTKDLRMKMNMGVRTEQNDLILNLFIYDGHTNYRLMKITLKDVVEYLWYRKIQIVSEAVFSIQESDGNFKLVPEPLVFNDPINTLFVITPKDVVEGMKIIISKELREYTFTRNENDLIITNSLNDDSHHYSLVTVVLNGMYADGLAIGSEGICDKMVSLSIEFDDKTIDLRKEMNKIAAAGDFPSMKEKVESKSYKQLLQAILENRQLFEQIESSIGEATDLIRSHNEFTSKNGWVSPLAYAVIEGKTRAARGLVRVGGASVTDKDIFGHSPLYYAVKYQRQEIIDDFLAILFYRKNIEAVKEIMTAITSELLVVKYVTRKTNAGWPEFDKNKKDTGATLLHFAAINGNLEVVKYLIEKGGEDGRIKAIDRSGQIPLYYAVKYNHSSVVDYFIQTIRAFGLVPLSFSIMIGRLEIVQYLIEKKRADIYEKDKYGQTPLSMALQEGFAIDYLIHIIEKEGKGQVLAYPIITGDLRVMESLMKYALKKNISVDERNIQGKTPLHYAAMNGYLEMTKMLVDRNADVRALDKSRRSPLAYALRNQHAKVVEYLCRKQRLDPLLTSAGAGKARLVKELIKDETDLHKADVHGNTLLHLAAAGGGSELVRYLIEKGLSLDARNFNGDMPLHHAASHGNVNIVKMLVSANNINARDKYGKTPLDVALDNKQTQVIIYLCEVKGEDALLVASKAGSKPIVKYLVENGANIHKRDEEQQTLLHLAVKSGELELVEYLVNSGIDPNVRNGKDQTPLHYVAMYPLCCTKSFQIGEFLIQKGAVRNVQDDAGWTPLVWVFDNNCSDFQLLQLLLEKGSDLNAHDLVGLLKVSFEKGIDENSECTQYLKRKISEITQRKRRQVSADQKYCKSPHIDTTEDNALHGANTPMLPQGDAVPSRWTNLGFLNWGHSLLQSKTDNSSTNSPSQISTHIDANGTIMLLDLLIRKNTGQKFVGTTVRVETPLEIQARALNIVQIFEETLKNVAFECGIDVRNLNFDPVAFQSTVIKQLQIGQSSEIPKTMYSLAKKMCSESNQCDKFLEHLRIHLELGKDERTLRKLPN